MPRYQQWMCQMCLMLQYCPLAWYYPDSKVHGANMGPIWGQQDPVGPHVGPMNFAVWVPFRNPRGHSYKYNTIPIICNQITFSYFPRAYPSGIISITISPMRQLLSPAGLRYLNHSFLALRIHHHSLGILRLSLQIQQTDCTFLGTRTRSGCAKISHHWYSFCNVWH